MRIPEGAYRFAVAAARFLGICMLAGLFLLCLTNRSYVIDFSEHSVIEGESLLFYAVLAVSVLCIFF